MLQIDGPYMMLLQLERARRGDSPATNAMLYASVEAEVSISGSLLPHDAAGQHQNEGRFLEVSVLGASRLQVRNSPTCQPLWYFISHRAPARAQLLSVRPRTRPGDGASRRCSGRQSARSSAQALQSCRRTTAGRGPACRLAPGSAFVQAAMKAT